MNRRRKLSAAEKAKLTGPKHPGVPYRHESSMYNERIEPILSFPAKGVLWYQGESDGMFSRGGKYRSYLQALITSWRKEFACGEIPSIVFQLPNYGRGSGWADLRDAQCFTANNTPKTDSVVLLDIGEAKDIHLNNKLKAARRAALIAKNRVYGKKNKVSGADL